MNTGAAHSRDGSRTWTRAAAKVTVALAGSKRATCQTSRRSGAGVLEYRIDWGPGYRVYFGKDGVTLVILLAGGTKDRQQRDIAAAQERGADYRRRRKEQT